jgi:hypothetical protein
MKAFNIAETGKGLHAPEYTSQIFKMSHYQIEC